MSPLTATESASSHSLAETQEEREFLRACHQGDTAGCIRLLKQNVSIQILDSCGMSALMIAASNGHAGAWCNLHACTRLKFNVQSGTVHNYSNILTEFSNPIEALPIPQPRSPFTSWRGPKHPKKFSHFSPSLPASYKHETLHTLSMNSWDTKIVVVTAV
jgi:hypothetical protein